MGAVPLMPRPGRIAGHVRLLGILWIALSAFRLIPGLVLFLVAHWMGFDGDIPFFVPRLLTVLGVVFLCLGVSGFVAGWGLLKREPWARMLGLVLGSVNLVDLPFGTALGIYTLWVLLPAESEQEYRVTSRPAQPVRSGL